MLIYDDLFGHHNKVETAIQRIKLYNPLELGFDKPYYVCYSGGKDSDCIRILIIDWLDDDVWEFLRYYGCESNPLYQCGYKRIGCVGCPNDTKRKEAFEIYSKFKEAYIRTFDRMLQSDFYKTKKPTWNSGEEVFDWWVSDKQKKISIDENQLTFYNFESVVKK